MARKRLHKSASAAWSLARRQHGVVTRAQLLELEFTPEAIDHRLRTGRLHRLWDGVYAVGRREVTPHGRWLAAVLRCGSDAVLSHESAAALWKVRKSDPRVIHVSVPRQARRSAPGISVHRRSTLTASDVTRRHGLPVTTVVRTLVDLATRLGRDELEATINEADKLDLVDPDALRRALDELKGQRGVPTLRATLDRRTFTLTDSELERRFLPIARRAGLAKPRTQQIVEGFRVDFSWPDLGLVVETDGLRYHRTPGEQARDRVRDQALTAAGLTPLRFTRAQVRYEPDHVQRTLVTVARRLAAQELG